MCLQLYLPLLCPCLSPLPIWLTLILSLSHWLIFSSLENIPWFLHTFVTIQHPNNVRCQTLPSPVGVPVASVHTSYEQTAWQLLTVHLTLSHIDYALLENKNENIVTSLTAKGWQNTWYLVNPQHIVIEYDEWVRKYVNEWLPLISRTTIMIDNRA